jgi:hypothetical protein
MGVGSKKIYHLEAWVVKVMNLYKVSFVCPGKSCRSQRFLQHFMLDIDMSAFD